LTRQQELHAGSVDAGPATELVARGRSLASFGDVEVLVVRTRRGVFAVENSCPHIASRSLFEASASGRTLVCHGHGRRFDLRSGEPLRGRPTCGSGLGTFDVTIDGGRLWLSPREQPARRSTHD
jgi:nitrite reductase/ring-hydroxylating ferredoxin subunit